MIRIKSAFALGIHAFPVDIEVDISDSWLKAGLAAIDDATHAAVYRAIRQKGVEPVRASFPEEDGLQKNVLVRSMTYQSDAFARELGINRLPCLVFFDDPRTNCPAGIPEDAKLPDRTRRLDQASETRIFMGDGLVQPHRARGIGAGINESEQLAARHSDQRARRHQPCRLRRPRCRGSALSFGVTART